MAVVPAEASGDQDGIVNLFVARVPFTGAGNILSPGRLTASVKRTAPCDMDKSVGLYKETEANAIHEINYPFKERYGHYLHRWFRPRR
jgi:hypothetical protein